MSRTTKTGVVLVAKIYRTTDRISVKIDDIVVKISPLTYDQKAEIQTHMLGFTRGDIREATKGVVLALKYGLKHISGVENSDGASYELSFEDNMLTDECVTDLMNIPVGEKLTLICSALLAGVPEQFKDNKGNALAGVEIVGTESAGKKS
jgi:hypothetical protein